MNKFYYAIIKIRDGEREYYSRTTFEALSIEQASDFANDYAKDFWDGGQKGDDNESGYWHCNGETYVNVDSIQEITKNDYNVLMRYI